MNDKEAAISDIIIGHILSEREGLGLPAPEPNSGLGDAARDTAVWFAGEEEFEEKILENLQRCYSEQPGSARYSLSLRLSYGRHVWPAYADPSEIAKNVIKRIDLTEVVSFPALDYLGMGSCHAVLDQSGSPVEITGGQPATFGYALVVTYATDGNNLVVERTKERRGKVGIAPLQISVPLRDVKWRVGSEPCAPQMKRVNLCPRKRKSAGMRRAVGGCGWTTAAAMPSSQGASELLLPNRKWPTS